jgi:hypothetical protein
MKSAFVLVVVGAFAAGFAGRRLDVGGAGATSADAVETLRRRVAELESARASETAARSSQVDAARDERPTETDRRLDALESRVAAATKQASDDAASAAADVDPELARLRGLADPALFEELRALSATKWSSPAEQTAGLARTIAVCDMFLVRRLDVSRRSQVMTYRGIAQRAAGDFEKAEATMREALALVDPISDAGFEAGLQLAFNRSFQYDVRGAAERFLALSQLPGLSPSRRALCRYKAADFFLGPANARDVARSRAEHQAVVDEFGVSDDPMARHWAEESRKAIANLDHTDDPR